MQGGFITYGLLAALATGLLTAAFTDLRRREIDNWLTAAIALGAPLFWMSTGISWLNIGFHIGIALATFLVLLALFAFGLMGGGDVKLLSALSLWITPIWYAKMILVMAIAGGALTLLFGAHHLLRRKREKLEIPYGVAISAAGLWVLASKHLGPLASWGAAG